MPDDRLHWLDRVAARHDAPPPGLLTTQAVATRGLSPESTNRTQFHVRCLPARPASAFAANADAGRAGRHLTWNCVRFVDSGDSPRVATACVVSKPGGGASWRAATLSSQ